MSVSVCLHRTHLVTVDNAALVCQAPAAYRLPCMSSPVEPCRKSRCTLGGLVEHPY